MSKKKKTWSGRFKQPMNPLALDFTQSISFDHNLYYYDIQGSLAHAKMLQRIGILSSSELAKITEGLESIVKDLQNGKFSFKEELEDVHLNIESALIERIGTVGGKLHTARSRNDQVALDVRLYGRDRLIELHDSLIGLEKVFLKKAKEFIDVMMPGYTHLQRAMPTTVGHWAASHAEALLENVRSLGAEKK